MIKLNFFSLSLKNLFKKRVILISIENFNREFVGKNILSTSFAKKGYIVLLAHKSIVRALVSYLPLRNHIYIEKGNRLGSIKYLSKAKKNNLLIYTFDEEGLMQTDVDTYSRKNHEKRSVKLIDGIFSWGPQHTELLKKCGFKNYQILKTGNTRFDYYLINKKNNNLNLYSNNGCILICSRFASANPNKEVKSKTDFRDGNGKYINDSKKMLGLMLNIPRLIREENIKDKIIIRPHPSESKKIWEKACEGLENVFISCEAPIHETLLETSVLIHNRCTTAIEGFLSNVNVISYEPFNLDSPPSPSKEFINSFAHYICYSDKDLLNSLKTNNLNKNIPLNNKANEYLYNLNSLSSSKIVEKIYSLYPFKFKKNNISLILIFAFIPIIILHHKIYKTFYRFFRFKYYSYLKQKNGNIKIAKLIDLKEDYLRIRFFSKISLFLPFKN